MNEIESIEKSLESYLDMQRDVIDQLLKEEPNNVFFRGVKHCLIGFENRIPIIIERAKKIYNESKSKEV